MKIRIGFGLGTRSAAGDGPVFRTLVTALETHGFDSLWASERINAAAPDPLVALAVAAGLTHRLKLGTSVLVLPGRNPVLLAKELASLDRLSGGRLLPAVGLGAADAREQQAFGVRREERAAIFDEMLPLLRRLWTEERVVHGSERWPLDGITVRPRPVQDQLDVWLGGRAPSELRRVGRLGDGWLPSFCTPADVAAGLPVITAEAERHGRTIDPEHIGALVLYREGPLPEGTATLLARRYGDVDADDLIPDGLDALRARLEGFTRVGASKFVVAPVVEPGDGAAWEDHLGRLAAAVLPLQASSS